MKEFNEKQLLTARSEFSKFKLVGEKNFSALNLKSPLKIYQHKLNTGFEELGCVGYNPKRRELTAHVRIKRSSGYAGDLCQKGSFEYVRFYLDYGTGWEDQGFVGFNVHDIPTEKDCASKPEKPLDFVARLRIKPKVKRCNTAVLPKVKAVLTWNSIPAPNDPNLTTPFLYVWGDVMEDTIQIRPKYLLFPGTLSDFELKDALLNKNVAISNVPHFDLHNTKKLHHVEKLDLQHLIETYSEKPVPTERFAHKLIAQAESTINPAIKKNISELFKANKLDLSEAFVAFNKLKCNTNFEELFCVGADYNREALIGTLKIKKPFGYAGKLCQKGSKEYVTFWIQNPKTCAWQKAGTTYISAHDIANIPSGGLSYSAILPFDFSKYKKRCSRPQVLKVRAVLSWNTVPTNISCSGYGNVVESYVQINPRSIVKKGPKLIAIGGVSVSNISDSTGLTLPGAKFRENQNPLLNNSPFGGKIVVEGISHQNYGQGYRVRVQNDTNGTSYYLNGNFTVEDVNGNPNVISAVGNVYPYQAFNDNPDNILMNFRPGGNDKLTIFIEHLDGTSSYQRVQLDNTFPVISMEIDDSGNCTHYIKGSTINGKFSVADNFLEEYRIVTTLEGGSVLVTSGTTNIANGVFTITTLPTLNCGSIVLKAIQKTVWDSAYTGTHRQISKIVCLK